MVRFILMIGLLALLAIDGVAAKSERVELDLRPRDLTPVTWLEAPLHKPVELVRDGKANAVVFVADPAGRENFDPRDYRYCNAPFPATLPRLVHELFEVVRLGTGAALERTDQAPPADRPAIVIGDCEETRRAGIDAAQLPIEGFVVRTASNRVYFVGSTRALPPGSSGKNDGTAWAVADFLERFAGARWYWPAEYGGRSVPRRASLVIPPVHYRDEPVFRDRTFHPEQNVLLPLSYAPHYDTTKSFMPLPLPFAPGVLPDGELYVTLVPHLPLTRYGMSLPYRPVQQGARAADLAGEAASLKPRVEAMFALKKDGSRNYGVLCYSAQETLDYLLECCGRAWDKGGNGGLWVTPSCVNLWFPFTPGLACNCPACRATASMYRDNRDLSASLTAQYGERRSFEMIEQLVHERVFGLFAKRLCEAVRQRWPDKKVVYHPWHTDCPKGVEFPDNLVVHNLDAGFRLGLMQQPVVLREQQDRLRAWRDAIKPPAAPGGSDAASRQIIGWRCGFYGPSDWTYGPVQFPHVVRDFYRNNRDCVVGSQVPTYSLPCWTTAAPTWYVWMRVLWNPELDVDATLDELCRRLFGRGAESARALLRLECERWEGATWTRPLRQEDMQEVGEGSLRFRDDVHFRESWPPDVVARMKALRDKALAETADEPRARQALLYWTWTFDEFVKYAASMSGNAAHGTNAIQGAGGPASTPAISVAAGAGVTAPGSAGGPGSTPAAAPAATPSSAPAAPPPVAKTNVQDGAEMVLIPAGEFLMGTSDKERAAWRQAYPDARRSDLITFTAREESTSFGTVWRGVDDAQRAAWLKDEPVRHDDPSELRDEMPQHKVRLDAFYMYKTEVTVAQYRKFCQATGRAMPPEPRRPGSGGRDAPKWQDAYPIVNVSWEDARSYAAWAGAALPTEAEWEKAARGGDRRVFPWGDIWPPPKGAGNVADQTFGAARLRSKYFADGYDDSFAFIAPVGSFAANPYGLHDLAGNVAEWCADWYDDGAYAKARRRDPTGPAAGEWRVVRGGSWYDGTPWVFRTASRGDYFHLPVSTYSFTIGFRCVVRVP